jgi:hypothetical protein
MNQTPKSKHNQIIFILSTIAFILIIFIVIQYFFKKKSEAFILQNDQLKTELREARIEINKYKGISEKLDLVVKEANIKIMEKESKIAKLVSENINIQKENTELKDEILEIKEDYLEVIDSLLVERGINSFLNSTIEDLENEIITLSKKVGIAELFVTENIIAAPIKESNFGRRQQTAMARKARSIKICFDILGNRIIPAGFYDIYLRIITPEGKILKHDDVSTKTFFHPVFEINAEYTAQEILNYKSEKVNKCITWNPNHSLKPGLYLVELFTDKQKLGTTTFTLK